MPIELEDFDRDGRPDVWRLLDPAASPTEISSPLKKASLTGFHATAKHIAAKAVSPSSETMRTI